MKAAHASDAVPDLVRRVYVESEGLPLFVAEYLAALRAGGDPAEESLPAEVRSVLDARLGGLGDMARQVLGAAAAIGRSFDLDTVRQASGRSDEETVGALEELVAQGVVREGPGPDPVYDFSHQKLRTLVYEQTSSCPAPAAPPTRGGRAVQAAAGRGWRRARRCPPAPGRRSGGCSRAVPSRRGACRLAARSC